MVEANEIPTVDATGLLCPLPVLKARKRLRDVPAGGRLQVLTDDPAALIDMPHFCAEGGHEVLSQSIQGSTAYWIIRKAG